MSRKINYASLFTLRSDGRFCASYTDETGRHFLYDRDPEKLHRKLERAKSAEKDAIMFTDVAEQWETEYQKTVTERTWYNFKPHYEAIKARHKNAALMDVSPGDVLAHLNAAKAQGYSRTIVNSIRVIYSGIFNYAAGKGWIMYNPALAVKMPKGLPQGKRRAPTDEEIKTICNRQDAPFGFFPFLLLCTGMRKGEALALSVSDIDFDAKEITVSKSVTHIDGATPTIKTPKNGKTRQIPIPDVLLAPLEEYCKGKTILFPAVKKGGYMPKRSYEGIWQRYCSAVGFVDGDGKPTLGAHNLRHGTATLLFESGVDVYTAQRILGHARLSTTMEIYGELRDKQYMKSVKKFSNSLSKKLSKAAR